MNKSWLEQIFKAEARVVRRNCYDVQRLVGIDALKKEAHKRGYSVVQHGDQYVILREGGV